MSILIETPDDRHCDGWSQHPWADKVEQHGRALLVTWREWVRGVYLDAFAIQVEPWSRVRRETIRVAHVPEMAEAIRAELAPLLPLYDAKARVPVIDARAAALGLAA